MSRSAEVILDWADGTYPFRLSIDQLAELQDKCGAGPWFIQWGLEAALMSRSLGLPPPKETSAAFVIEPLRLGLIGGGMPAVEALKRVRDYVGPGQLNDNIMTAFAVVSAALQGVPEDEPEKSEVEAETSASRSHEDESGSRKSTDQEPQSD